MPREPDDRVCVDEAGGCDPGIQLPVSFRNPDVSRSADALDLSVLAHQDYAIRERGAGHGATDNGSASVSVLLNRGDGSFRKARAYTTGDPTSVAIGDLNGDRKLDLVTTNDSANTVSVLVNRGDGSFQANLDYSAGPHPYSVAIGDLNGDRKLDLVTANPGPHTVSVLINRPGLCTVQNVKGQTLPMARRTIPRANCRVGRIRGAYSKTVARGRVISELPKAGAVLPGGGKVNLVVSLGRKR